MLLRSLTACIVLAAAPAAHAQDAAPDIRTYKTVAGTELKVHVLKPSGSATGPRPAMILLHGGGWNVGSPEWTYDRAKVYASRGMVAIGVQYRLSDFKTITPLDAMADTRDAIRWVRSHAGELGVDPARIAVYAWSAGGHLGVSAFLFDDAPAGAVSAAPNALVLMSPALSIASSGYVRALLAGRAEPSAISPAEHVRSGMPPVVIFNGDQDVVTTIGGARRFCDAVRGAGGRCDLHVYPGAGHLLTRKLDRESQEMGPFEPDPKDVLDATAKGDAFLVSLGYLPPR
jgi:acetyl esterase/lipase